MLKLLNETPFLAYLYPGWNLRGEHQLTCVVKVGYSFNSMGRLQLLKTIEPIVEADRHYGEPRTTSLAAANEVMPYKQGAEWFVSGTVVPNIPRGCVMKEVAVALTLPSGRHSEKKLRVMGARHWRVGMFGIAISRVSVLQPLPLRYEYAYGGYDALKRRYYAPNPVGQGYILSCRSIHRRPLPQIEQGPEYIKHIRQRPQPAGFGPMPRVWLDPKVVNKLTLHNMAPLDQRCPEPFCGGEQISLIGLVGNLFEPVTLVVPSLKLQLDLKLEQQVQSLQLCWDTAVINTDTMTLHCIGRVTIPWRVHDPRSAQGRLRACS